MSIEIERKFLVKKPFQNLAVGSIEIVQAYLSVDPARIVRVRITDKNAFLTIKSDSLTDSISRNEWEFVIQPAEAEEIMKICIPGRIVKTRYYVPAGKNMFEVDVFHDKNEGLIVAELELSFESEQYERPEWLGEEVTGNPAYSNVKLIK
jgi:adenylate cyclase